MSQEKKGGKRLQKNISAGKSGGGKKAGTPGKKKVQRTRAESVRHGLFIALTVISAIIVVGFILFSLLTAPPDVPDVDRPQTTTMVDEQGNMVEVVVPGVASDRKKEFYTFLLVGRDTGGGGNTDTMMLVSYDVPNQKLNVMSLPRDTMVNIPYDIKRLNAVYNYNGGGEAGIEALDDEIAALVGFTPDFQVVVEWEAFGELVDAIGGVNFEVPFRMYYNDLSQGFKIDLQAGYQNLNGDEAMQLIRFRQQSDDEGNAFGGYPNGDLGRIQTQQAFLKALIEQCLQMDKLLSNLGDYIDIFNKNVTTNLTVSNMAYFGKAALTGLKMENVGFHTLPNESCGVWSRTYSNYQSYVVPKADELVALVNEHFNPYVEDLTKSELDIMYVNNNGTIGSTTGNLEDTKANQSRPPVRAESTPKPEETQPAESQPVESPADGEDGEEGGALLPPGESGETPPEESPSGETPPPAEESPSTGEPPADEGGSDAPAPSEEVTRPSEEVLLPPGV